MSVIRLRKNTILYLGQETTENMITTMEPTTKFDVLTNNISTVAPTNSTEEKIELARIPNHESQTLNRISGPVRNRNCGDRVVLLGLKIVHNRQEASNYYLDSVTKRMTY